MSIWDHQLQVDIQGDGPNLISWFMHYPKCVCVYICVCTCVSILVLR